MTKVSRRSMDSRLRDAYFAGYGARAEDTCPYRAKTFVLAWSQGHVRRHGRTPQEERADDV